jgi:alkylation response protein AidB-like acyl-CoA dehydrogenase
VLGASLGTGLRMRLMRGAVAIGIARRVYTEARKPENQRRIKQAADALRKRQATRTRRTR